MKTLALLLFTACTIQAQEADAKNYLTTRTVKTGKEKVIAVVIKQHKEVPIQLELLTGKPREVINVTIPAGQGHIRAEYTVYNGWMATITANGNIIDQETAMRKTGLGTIK